MPLAVQSLEKKNLFFSNIGNAKTVDVAPSKSNVDVSIFKIGF